MEAVTAQNDLLLTAYTGCLLYFLLSYRESRALSHLLLAGVAFALALGVKETMLLVIPSLLVVAIPLFLMRPKPATPLPRRHVALAVAGWMLALIVLTLPSGYADNIRRFQHPLGPVSVRREHTLLDTSPDDVLRIGMKNILRYSIDFFTLDGMPFTRTFQDVQLGLHALPQ
jgi:hypothetical protein